MKMPKRWNTNKGRIMHRQEMLNHTQNLADFNLECSIAYCIHVGLTESQYWSLKRPNWHKDLKFNENLKLI